MNNPTNQIDWDAIAEELKRPVNQDAITSTEFAEKLGVSQSTAYRRLKEMILAGTAVECIKYITTHSGLQKPVLAYSLVTKKPRASAENS